MTKAAKPHVHREPAQVERRKSPQLDGAIRGKIGQQLRLMFSEIVDEGVPERFMNMLRRLDGEAAQAHSFDAGQQRSLDTAPVEEEICAAVEEPPRHGHHRLAEASTTGRRQSSIKVFIAAGLCALGAIAACLGLLTWMIGLFQDSYLLEIGGTGALAAGAGVVALTLLAGEEMLLGQATESVAGGHHGE